MIIYFHGGNQLINNDMDVTVNLPEIRLNPELSYKIRCRKLYIGIGTPPNAGLFLLSSNMVAKRPENVYGTIMPILIRRTIDKVIQYPDEVWNTLVCSDPFSFKFQLKRNDGRPFALKLREIYFEIEIQSQHNNDWIQQ